MLKRLSQSALVLVSAAALWFGVPAVASADVPVQFTKVPITGTGTVVAWQLQGASTCEVQIVGSPVGLSAAVTTNSDPLGSATPVAADAVVGTSTITTTSNNIYSVPGSGLGQFKVVVNAFTSGTTTLYAICGPPTSISSVGGSLNVNATIVAPLDGSGNVLTDCAIGCNTAATGSTLSTITSASATTCTALKTSATVLKVIWNSGPAMTVFIQFYNDNGTCAAGDLLYGDGSTLVLGPGQILSFGSPLTALSYKISAAVSSNLWLVTTP